MVAAGIGVAACVAVGSGVIGEAVGIGDAAASGVADASMRGVAVATG